MAHTVGRGRYKSETYPAPPAAASAGGNGRPFVWWRPDGTGTAKTWAEVMTKLGGLPDGIIYCDQVAEDNPVYVVDVGVFNLREAFFQSPVLGDGIQITVPEGAVLDNLGGAIGRVQLQFSPTATQPLTFSRVVAEGGGGEAAIQLSYEASLFNEGSIPLVVVSSTTLPGRGFLSIYLDQGAQLIGSATALIASVLDTGFLDLYVTNNNPRSSIPLSDQSVGGAATASVNFIHDGSIPLPIPTSVAPLPNPANLAMGTLGGVGPTAFRPSAPRIGTIYYDTDIATYIFWNGAWVPL